MIQDEKGVLIEGTAVLLDRLPHRTRMRSRRAARCAGQYAEARKEYEAGLEVAQELGDLRAQGVSLGQLGTLAMREGKLSEARDRYRAALAFFQQLGEPTMEAVAWHQLGMVFQQAGQWDESEQHYREAARLRENLGLIGGSNGAAAS